MLSLTRYALLPALAFVMLFAVACGDSSSAPNVSGASAGDVAAAARMAAEAVNRDSAGGVQGILVTGSGSASAEPDLAMINIGVEVLAPSVGAALTTANSSLERILASLADHNVAEEDTQTRYFNINTQYDYRGEGAPVVIGYEVTNELSVKLRNLDSLGQMISDVVDAGGDPVRVNGINFAIEDTAALEDAALAMAMENAKAQAERMAELSDVELGDLVSVSLSGGSFPAPLTRIAAESALSAPTPIRSGDLEITVTVQALYAIK